MEDTIFGKNEKRMLAYAGYENFVSSMEYAITQADTVRPDVMFCRICLIKNREKQVGVSIEGDHRLFAGFFGLPADTPVKILLKLCAGQGIPERRAMVNSLPVLAEAHETAWATIEEAKKNLL